MSPDNQPEQLTLFVGVSPVRTSPLPDAAKDWLESAVDSGASFIEFCLSFIRNGLWSKMSLAYYPATRDGTLPSSFGGWQNAGMASRGEYLTLSISESPNDGDVCLLSEVLEMDVPRKYYLSAVAAKGILRRAVKRGRSLPPTLQQALEAAASTPEPPMTLKRVSSRRSRKRSTGRPAEAEAEKATDAPAVGSPIAQAEPEA